MENNIKYTEFITQHMKEDGDFLTELYRNISFKKDKANFQHFTNKIYKL